VETHETTLTLESMPQRTPGIDIRSAGSEQLVQSPANGNIHVLNALAGRVLMHCDGATTIRGIVSDLVATTTVDQARAERDVLSVCESFRAKGLIA
jgi:hypothetical protein